MHLGTEKVEYEDINGHKKSSGFDLSGEVNISKDKGTKAKLGGQASAGYHRNHAKQKITSSLGQGTVIERSGNTTDIKRGAAKSPLSYLDTQSEMKVDNKMVELVVDLAVKPVETMKEVVADIKIIYNTGKFAVKAVGEIKQNGLVGTVESLRLGLATGGAAVDLTKEENETHKIGEAEDSEQFGAALSEEGVKFQLKMGVKNPAEVNLCQENNDPLEDTAYAHQHTSFDEETNTINYNTSRKGFNKIETVAKGLAHGSTRKAISENKWTKRYINDEQEASISRLLGAHAKRMAKSVKR
ncbi:MAG: hypothetical protein BGO68_03405 [Candidatus Amoebophilus sp. 36-38]|nr:MAG: hypothetical protein BGO68_03405 [Candidatus Amoebophilus sp. 36-38]